MQSTRIVLAALIGSSFAAQPAAAQPSEAASFLSDCAGAGRRLWNRSLCAPVVIVDPATGAAAASEPMPGPLPPLRANTAFDWGGRKWIMVLRPLGGDEAARRDLLFHEAWHVHQEALGLPANNAVAAHLDGWRERSLIRLEWNALAEALRSRGQRMRGHVAHALAFRRQRLALGAGNAAAERAQMRHEGLAAYTGAALSGNPIARALAMIEGAAARPSLGRSFAYVSGPAWGLLLDRLAPGWRRRLAQGRDLPDLMPVPAVAAPRPDRYDGTRIMAVERQAAEARDTRLRASLAATSEQTGLRLPLAQMQMDFSPDRISTGPDGSTIYHRITLRDAWGRVSVEGLGLRILSDFRTAFAPWPLPPGALQLAPGWRVVEQAGGGARVERRP